MNIIITIVIGVLFAFGLVWHDQPGRVLTAAIPSDPDTGGGKVDHLNDSARANGITASTNHEC
jgi:hypothetical protein